ncbi:MAG: MlaD family protein [Dysgonamonadaceae bacterium]|jgi:phospholipid/cholesterol/gamma-HCH transport system substrate-binding protein|nr:MlaD family protein [Dysgonamonadaceae bacterium]
MKKIFNKEVTIGVVTIISLFVLYFGINYMKGINLFKPTNHYYVSMPNVSELQKSGPVFIDGFRVGTVNSIQYKFDEVNTNNIVVQISLDENIKLKTGSYIELKSGLTSGAYLNLIINRQATSYCQAGDTIEGISSIGLMDQLSAELLPQIENLLPRLDSILLGIQVLVNHPALVQSLNHIEVTAANLQNSSNQLNQLLSKDVPVIVSSLNKVSSDFTVVSSRLKELDLQATFAKIDKVMQNIDQMSGQLNSKDNTLGLLLNDRSLYDHLDSTARNASNLFLDIKEHPKNYVHFSVF